MFIPWLLFEPLAFLFWGWFRTLIVYTLYGVVAGAILRVFMGVGMGYVTTYTGALMGTGSSDPAELGLWVVVLLPLVVSGLMAGMKVGELAAMLVSGSGSVGSGIDGARGARRRTPQRCREPGPPPNPRRLKETSMNREHDAGREYAEIWGETVEANRKLRTLATILAAACLALAVLLLRVATVEPPRPIVVRVDEVGRAEAVAYEAATAQADPLDPTTKYFLNRFIADFYSQATGDGRGALDAEPPASSRPSWRTPRSRRDGAEVAAMAAGTADTEHQVEQVVLRIHPAPEAPHGATADFDLVHLRQGQETLSASGGRSRSGSPSSPSSPPSSSSTTRWASSSPTSRPTVPWSRSRPGDRASAGTGSRRSSRSAGRDARPNGSRSSACTAACSPAPRRRGSWTRITSGRAASSTR